MIQNEIYDKTILTVLICLALFLTGIYPCVCMAQEIQAIVKPLSKYELADNTDKRIFKKYNTLEISFINNSPFKAQLPEKISYMSNSILYEIPNNSIVYEQTKRHLIRRAIIWGVAGGGLLSWYTIPASMAHTQFYNPILQDSIIKNNYRAKLLFTGEKYSTYVFIPKKQNAEYVQIDGIRLENGKTINITSKIQR